MFSETYPDLQIAMEKEVDAIIIEDIAIILWRKMAAENEIAEKKFKAIGNLVVRDARFFWDHNLESLSKDFSRRTFLERYF